ncbi:unnamed protein product [Cunninghamella blakesleeana]
MATFSKQDFDAASYLTYRPSYNKTAYKQIVEEHKGSFITAVDLGCGPGTVAFELSPYFENVIGIDPSKSMLSVAEKNTKEKGLNNLTFKQGYGEALPLEDNSVDVITVAQALHWFDPEPFIKEVIRVLKKDGTLITFGYQFGKLLNLGDAYKDVLSQLADIDYNGPLGPYYEKNRPIATAGFISWLPPFQQHFHSVIHRSYPVPLTEHSLLQQSPWMDDSLLTLRQFIGYIKTFSAYKNWLDDYHLKHPEEKDKQVDVYDTFLKDKLPPGITMDTELLMQWPHSIFIVSNPKN